MRKISILAALLLLAPGISQAQSLEDLLAEKGVITKSEARASHHMGGGKVYWNEGSRLDFADTGFTANISTQLQTRYEFSDIDEGQNTSSFDIRTARISISGTALNEEFSYMVQTEFAGESAELLDAYIQWNACEGMGLRMGQFKTPISRQFGTSVSQLQFADRSSVSDAFTLGRQSGLMGMMDLGDTATLSAGIFNGLSDGEFSVDGSGGLNRSGVDTRHTGTVSLRADLMGEMDAFEEGDVHHTEDAALNMGVTYALSQINSMPAGKADVHSLSGDLNFKSQGLSFHTEAFWHELDIDSGSSVDNWGLYAQLGYFVMPKKLELAARYGYLDCDDGSAVVFGGNGQSACASSDKLNEIDASINYYWWAHHLKAQIGWNHLNKVGIGSASDSNDNRWLLQLSSWF